MLLINNVVLRTGNYGNLVDFLGHSLESALFWTHSSYSPHLFVDQEDCATFSLQLVCDLFAPLAHDLNTFFDESAICISRAEKLTLEISYLTEHHLLPLDSLIDAVNYLVVIMVFNLEPHWPLVFSPFARNLFKINYNWLIEGIKVVALLKSHQLPREKLHLVIASKLLNMQTHLATQYTTLQVISRKTYQSRLAHERKNKPDPTNEKRQFDMLPVSFRLADLAAAVGLLL